MKGFASDNYAGVLPEVMLALRHANAEHAASYGSDPITQRVTAQLKDFFEADVTVAFVFNGTGANVLSMSAATESYHSILSTAVSHICNDESTAPETFTGCRMIPVPPSKDGKLTVDSLIPKIIRKGDIHFAQPKLISLTQATEYGTVYTADEIASIATLARQHDMYVHMDGARFFNALATLQCSPATITSKAGIDILSLGGTKAGMMYGEAVVVFHPKLAKAIRYKQKQVMQLASKTRFIAAQFEALLQEDLWRQPASHSNQMAQVLFRSIQNIPAVQVTMPVQANAVFATLPPACVAPLQAQFPFYVWDEATHEVRLMCSFDTTAEEISAFSFALQKQIAEANQ